MCLTKKLQGINNVQLPNDIFLEFRLSFVLSKTTQLEIDLSKKKKIIERINDELFYVRSTI